MTWYSTSGAEGETYGEGVRRRLRSAGKTWLLCLICLAVGTIVYSVTGSVYLTILAAFITGIASALVEAKSFVGGEMRDVGGAGIWLILFVPVVFVLAAVTFFAARDATTGFDAFQASLPAFALGSLFGFTKAFFLLRKERRP